MKNILPLSLISMIESLAIVFTILIPLTNGRGPHHPRGAGVSEHHVHYRPTRSEDDNEPTKKLTQDTGLLHDTEHIKEDLGSFASARDLSSMSDAELEFYYFTLHDFDNNSRLDGLEILQAVHHTALHEHPEDDGEEHEEEVVSKDEFEFYIELIDQVLQEDDIDGDGYLSYTEYVIGRMKDGKNGTVKEKKERNVKKDSESL